MSLIQPQSINDLPYDDALLNKDGSISDSWRNALSQLTDFLSTRVSQLGHFIPNITEEQRDSIPTNPSATNSVVDGQIIFNTTTGETQIWENGSWNVK